MKGVIDRGLFAKNTQTPDCFLVKNGKKSDCKFKKMAKKSEWQK